MQNENWIEKYRTELIILSIVILVFTASMYIQMCGFFMTFMDTDDYMRIVRIREFFQHHDISNRIIERCNVPYGCNLHWTRFYDFFLIVPSYILSFFTDSINSAIDYVCFCIGPVIRIATVCVLLRIIQKFMNRDDSFLCLLLFAVNPIIAVNGNFGRPDHHAFILLFITIFLLCMISVFESAFKKKPFEVALTSAICIWISPETLIPLLLVDGILFVYALSLETGLLGNNVAIEKGKAAKTRTKTQEYQNNLIDSGNILKFLYRKNMEITLYLGLIILPSYTWSARDIYSLVIIATFMLYIYKTKTSSDNIELGYIISLLIWYILGLNKATPVLYDEISIVHYFLYACSAALFFIMHKNAGKNNFLRICTFIVIFAATFLYRYPDFIFGMEGSISPYVKRIWLYKVSEMRSPIQSGDTAFYILHLLFVAAAVCNKVNEIYKGKYDKDKVSNLFWVVICVCSSVYTVFAGFSNRMLQYSSFFSLPLLFELGMNSTYTKKLSRLVRIIITFFISILFIFFASTLDEDDEDENPVKQGYTSKELYTEIDKLSSEPVVIMAHTNDGPAILYYTKHKVVGAPYHRQEAGIISSYRVMEDSYNEKTVRDILDKTNASYIFVRKKSTGASQKATPGRILPLPSMLARGIVPNWLEIQKLPKKFDNVIVAKVIRDKKNDSENDSNRND